MHKLLPLFACIAMVCAFGAVDPVWAETDPVLRIDPGGHMSVIWRVAFSKDGRFVVSAGEDKTIRVWNVETGALDRLILGAIGPDQEGKVLALALSPDNSLLASGGFFPKGEKGPVDLGLIRLHDFTTGEIKAVLRGHTNVVTALAFSSDGRFLASGGGDRDVRVWSLDPRPLPLTTLSGHSGLVSAVGFSEDGKRLVSASYDSTLRLWDIESGKVIREMKGHTGQIWTAAYSPDGKYIVSAGYQDRALKLWDGLTGEFIKDLARPEQGPPGLAFSPDGNRIVLGAQEGNGTFACPVYEIPSGKMIARFEGHDNSVKAVAVSPDGRMAASGGGIANDVCVWELETGKIVRKMTGVGSPVMSVGIAPDNSAIAWGNRVDNPTWRKLGPFEKSFMLQRNGKWRPSPGGPVRDQSKHIGAVHSLGPYALAIRQGGPNNWHSILEVYKNGQKLHAIARGAHDGAMHRSFTFTPDGKAIVSGGNNGVLQAYDTETGRVLARFVGHESEVWAVAVSRDGRFLVSGSNDQTIRVWPLGDLGKAMDVKPLISIFAGSDREWIAWTPNGYYESSIRGDRYVGWHVNGAIDQAARFFPADRFVEKFYRPDVVEAVLDQGGLEAGMTAANEKKALEAEADVSRMLPPVISLIEPQVRLLETERGSINLKAMVRSINREPVTRIQVLVNGRPVSTRDLIQATEGEKHEFTLDREVALRPGENNLTLIASNAKAHSNPQTVTIIRKDPGKSAPPPKRKLYILAVGVSQYQIPAINLNVADSDARSVADYFTQKKGLLYSAVHVRTLLNEEATRGNILDGLDWLMSQAGPEDVALVFLAGHGVNDEKGSYYFLGHDVDPNGIRRTGIEWFHFQEVLTGIPSTIVLMADTCHSGAITGKRVAAEDIDMTRALKLLVASGSGVVVMTASTGNESSMESPDWGHGAFTKAVLEGLGGQADYDRNGLIDLKEIDLYISHRVNGLTGGRQHPTTEIPATLPNFPIAAIKNPPGE